MKRAGSPRNSLAAAEAAACAARASITSGFVWSMAISGMEE
jgi:hypothetical protein